MWDVQPATPGFVIAMATAVVLTLLTPKPPSSVVALFDRVNAEAASPGGERRVRLAHRDG